MQITEESTRFVFRDYSNNELSILRKLISADGNHFLYEDADWIACPVGVENYIKRKFPEVKIVHNTPWSGVRIKNVPGELPPPRNRLQKDALKFMREYKDRSQLGLICAPGQGKCIPLTAKIPTPDGYKLMGDLNVGDYVFDRTGNPTKILAIYNQELSDIYRITFSDGRTADCTLDHLWPVIRYNRHGKIRHNIIPLSKMIEKCSAGKKMFIPTASSVKYTKRSVSVDPWVVGCFVACGYFDSTLSIKSISDEIPDRISKICGFTYQKTKNNMYHFFDNNGIVNSVDFFSKIPDFWKSQYRMIPDEYMFNDRHTRIQFIHGMIDSNAWENGYNIYFPSNSRRITKQFISLLHSVGFGAQVCYDNQCECIDIKIPDCDKWEFGMYKSNISIAQKDHNYHQLMIVSINKVGKSKTRCILVDNPEHLYLTEDFIVTHNTYMSINHAITVGEKTLIICPTSTILTQWISTLTDLFNIPRNRILHVNGTDKINQMKNDYDWVLVLEQTLQPAIRKNELESILKDCHFGTKIIDEIHMFLRNNIAIDCCSNIKHNIYLTGTFFRTQEEESNLFNAVYHGILRFEVVDQEDIEKYGQKKHINVYSVIINSKLTKSEVNNIIVKAKIGRKSAMVVSVGRYMQIVCPDNGRITEYMKQSLQVVKRMRERVGYGRMLILVPSIYATKQFRKLISEMFPKLKVGCINSEQTRSLNNKVKEEADIVVSTSKSAGVGFDMSDLSVLIAVEQFRSPVMVEQISGRLRPRKDGKPCYYVDIADKSLGQYLLRWRNERLERLKVKAKSYEQFRISSDN